ncbi:MAG: 1-(5-phosphoribosyl)-5-[(5-phosphoribosylamino)methylideneamino] imidazole-4-carboxamide isomerase [Bacteroidetes bacterium]|nr:1-(5-phosphoribosyl)-5-[(5-phosphoribosylamino)methylideneamino] imidazole-4-carboxamide isomerase [Bacteroidota bacterium]MBU1678741.1 1-(5-phosphoribosyl)-5-[(5-phosphoribosylamino)methylideneamino] imidazole-4-carboxamide isomerase [Bacteroidota bacterium]MBU2507495.1 1-(5-phosphoribosyl)-5-[(5-phosphoribosylamino)methylideneamino] imidazole-4-carboxamide isomerase [Bacteroidota bacterium]
MAQLLVIPSIDIKDGKTVRIVQGIPELNCKAYGNDPVEMAMIWRAENAKCLHVVDFDSSHHHSHKNFGIVKNICESVVIPVEFGGGISTIDDAQEAMDIGIFRLIIGSMAFLNRKEFEKIISIFGPKKISAAIDVIDDFVYIKGRTENTNMRPVDFAKNLEKMGIERCIVTDVKKNGMLRGANIELSKQIAEQTSLKVTHSGGIAGYEDLNELNQYTSAGIDSVIIGRALYENNFACQKIWRVAESGIFN